MGRIVAFLQHAFLARRGRLLAIILLLGLAGLSLVAERIAERHTIDGGTGRAASVAGQLETAIELLAGPMTAGRQVLFDSYQQLAPRVRVAQPVTIVEIDEKSLKQVGQWPWPRNRLAALVQAINARQPAAIGLDIYMPEPDATSPAQVAANLPAQHKRLAAELARLPDHDAQLARALAAAPSVIGAAGFDFATQTTSAGLRTAPIAVSGHDPLPYVRQFPYVLASIAELQAAARGQAVLSVSAAELIVRRVPLVVAIGDRLAPSLALEMLRIATGDAAIRLTADRQGVRQLDVAELTVPTQADGAIWLHFARRAGALRQISAADVLDGKVEQDLLQGKLVLIGLTGSGLSDMRNTVLGEQVPGIEIQAQVLESLFDGRFLLRPWWLKTVELSLLIGFGLLLIWLLPQRQGRFARLVARLPNGEIWLVLAVNGLLLGAGYALFRQSGLLLDTAGIFIGSVSVLASLVLSALIESDRENRQLTADRQRLREESARLAGELSAAERIQRATLPQPDPQETRFQVAAVLEPAREVGGDFYDFYMVDDRHLFFVIGDVTDKGLVASLFMVITKALAKSVAMRGQDGVAAIVTTTDKEIARENPQSLFVTMLAGMLDTTSGEVELCSAGHDLPWQVGADGQARQAAAEGGPPLCVLPGYEYGASRLQLAPGDCLCLVTDGVTEATNGAGEFYGGQRLAGLMLRLAGAGAASAATAQSIVAAIRADVASFVGAAPQADDLTLLAVRWGER